MPKKKTPWEWERARERSAEVKRQWKQRHKGPKKTTAEARNTEIVRTADGRYVLRRIRKDWSKIRRVIMTRAIYTKCRTHPEVAQRLLETGEKTLVETTQFDYFWGCGRDRRGRNIYGAVLMDVRKKLRDEAM